MGKWIQNQKIRFHPYSIIAVLQCVVQLGGEAMKVTEHFKLHFFLMFLIKWIANAMDDFRRQ